MQVRDALTLLRSARKYLKGCDILSPHNKCELEELTVEIDALLGAMVTCPPRLPQPRSEPYRTVVTDHNEACAVCFKLTRRWFELKDVALCFNCSYYAPGEAIPSKREWCELVETRRAAYNKALQVNENVD